MLTWAIVAAPTWLRRQYKGIIKCFENNLGAAQIAHMSNRNYSNIVFQLLSTYPFNMSSKWYTVHI